MSKCSKYPVDLTKFKSVNFEIDKHKSLLAENTIIVFKYGINLPNSYNMMGKIIKIHTEKDSFDIITKDRGIRTTIPSMIEKIYLPKDKIADKENRIKCITNGNSSVPRFDAAIDKVIFKIKNIRPDIVISDERVDNNTEFSRFVEFSTQNMFAILNISSTSEHILFVINNKLLGTKGKDKHINITKYGIDTWSIVDTIKKKL